MGTFKTLKELQDKAEEATPNRGASRDWLKLKDGDRFAIRFLQELAEDSDNYNEDRGAAQFVPLHTNPLNFRNKIRCTMDTQGQCFACEQMASDPENAGKWKAKLHCYINVAVMEDGDWKVRVLDQTYASSHVIGALTEFAKDKGSITDRVWKIYRKGSGLNTEYGLMNDDREEEPKAFDKLELFELDNILPEVDYDEQEKILFRDKDDDKNNNTDSW